MATDKLPCPPKLGGAIETFVYGISKELTKYAEVHVITIGDDDCTYKVGNIFFHYFTLSKRMKNVGSAAFFMLNEKNRDLLYINCKILKCLRKISKVYGPIDCIHSHHFNTCIAPIFFRHFYRKSVSLVLHYHNIPKKNAINKWVAKEYDLLLAISAFVKSNVVSSLVVSDEKVKVTHNAVDPTVFKYNEAGANEIRVRFSLDNSPVLLFVGRIIPEKGLQVLLEVLPTIRIKFPSVKLLVVGPLGDFSGKNYNSSLASELKKADSVVYLGQISIKELVKVCSVADICVVPSIWQEPFGLVVIESMACSKPVVAFRVGGIPEIITNGKDGILVSERNKSELAYLIMHLLENADLRKKMGFNARMTATTRFSYENLVAELNRLYGELSKKRI